MDSLSAIDPDPSSSSEGEAADTGQMDVNLNNDVSAATNTAANPPNPPLRTAPQMYVRVNSPNGVRAIMPATIVPPRARVILQQAAPANNQHQQQQEGESTTTTNQPQPQTIHIRQTPSSVPVYQPLEAQPLPNQINYDDAIPSSAQNDTKPIDVKQFECSICFEYMDTPVRCGSSVCSSRFCAPCLTRVLREEISNRAHRTANNNDDNNNDETNNDQSAKCPTCRNSFTKEDIQVDLVLQKQINDSTNTITCPFKGCNTEVTLGQLKQHEESCPYIRMKCKYAEWGCKWTGRKMDLQSHYDHECDYCSSGPGLPKFIERYRKTVEHDHRRWIDQHRVQLQGVNQMQSIQSRQVMMMKSRNPADIVDIIALSYQACCYPGRFVLSRDLWSSILMKQGSRATLGNMMLSFPTMVLVIRVSVQGLCLLQHPDAFDFGTETFWEIHDTALMAVMIFILGLLYKSCFYIDLKSPYEWSQFSLKNLCDSQPLIRDVAAICITMIYFLAFEHFEFSRGVIMWHAIAFVTLFLTSFVMCMVMKASGSASPQPRTWAVIVFGLRYGLVTSYCDFNVRSPVACFFAIVVGMRILRLISKLPDFLFLESSECFLRQFTPTFLVASAAIWIRFLAQSEAWDEELIDWFCGMLLLGYANFTVFLYSTMGDKLASIMYTNAVQANRAHPGSSLYPHPIGSIVFGMSSFLLVGVAFLLKVGS